MEPQKTEPAKWVVRAYYLGGERVEEYTSESDGWAAAKRHLANGVAVAGPSGPLDPDDERRKVKQLGATADTPDALDFLFRKWTR